MKLKTSDNRNISVSSVNGYTVEKVKKAKQYLDEIGSNKRHFDFKRLVAMYNDIKGTNDSPNGCSCQSPKYYNGIQNYYNYGKLTLINNGYSESDFEDKKEETPAPIENEEKRINLGNEEVVSEALKEDDGAVVKDEEDKASDEPKNDVVEEKKKAGRPKKSKE